MRADEANNPKPRFETHLDRNVRHHGQARTWREILRLEAQQIKQALEGNQPYRAWLWGVSA